MERLKGKTAVITGAGRGIGREIALLFAREGANVVVNDLGVSVAGEGPDATPAAQVAAEIKAAGGNAIANGADVAEMDQAEALIKSALDEWGQLDVLVNVAGILRDRMVFNMTGEEWDAVVRVHMRGTFATTRFASLVWRQQRTGGRLINFTSGAGLFGAPGQPNYAAAKMGILGFTLSCARSLGKYGVTSNCIGPAASTRMTTSIPTDRASRGWSETKPGDEMDPANTGPVLVYLASDDGGWVNGRCFGTMGYRITLYSLIKPEVVLQGTKMWDVEDLFKQFEPAFGTALGPKPTAD